MRTQFRMVFEIRHRDLLVGCSRFFGFFEIAFHGLTSDPRVPHSIASDAGAPSAVSADHVIVLVWETLLARLAVGYAAALKLPSSKACLERILVISISCKLKRLEPRRIKTRYHTSQRLSDLRRYAYPHIEDARYIQGSRYDPKHCLQTEQQLINGYIPNIFPKHDCKLR